MLRPDASPMLTHQDLAINVLYVLYAFSSFSQFHPYLVSAAVGSQILSIVALECKRHELRERERAKEREAAAKGDADKVKLKEKEKRYKMQVHWLRLTVERLGLPAAYGSEPRRGHLALWRCTVWVAPSLWYAMLGAVCLTSLPHDCLRTRPGSKRSSYTSVSTCSSISPRRRRSSAR